MATFPKGTKAAKEDARLPAPPRVTMISKGELRAQIEKLEKILATLRTSSRETNKAAKAAMTRISELEAQSRSWRRWQQQRRRQLDKQNPYASSARAARLTQVMRSRPVSLFRTQRLLTRKPKPLSRTWKSTSLTTNPPAPDEPQLADEASSDREIELISRQIEPARMLRPGRALSDLAAVRMHRANSECHPAPRLHLCQIKSVRLPRR